MEEPHHGGAHDDLQLAVSVEVREGWRGVDVSPELGVVGGQVEVHRGLDGPLAQVEDHDAARNVLGGVQVVPQLCPVLLRPQRTALAF